MGKAKIKVLGTSFNVKAYDDRQSIEVTVHSGTVILYDSLDEKITLKAGEKGIYSKTTHSLEKTINDDLNFLSWKTRKLVFRNNTLTEITSVLSDVYHINIVLNNDNLRLCRVTASFDNQALDEVLNVLKETLDLNIQQKESGIVISGNGC